MANPAPYRLETPYRFGDWFDLDEARKAARAIALTRRSLEEQHDDQVEAVAEKERDYRKELAKRFTTHRAEGKGSGESELLAQGDCADLRFERDIAEGLLKSIRIRLEGAEGERANFRQLADWSARLRVDGREAA